MTQINVQAVPAIPANGTGITIGYAKQTAGDCIRIGISRAAQRRYFGGQLHGQNVGFLLLIDDAPDKRKVATLKLATDGQEALAAQDAGFEAVVLKLLPWCAPMAEKIKAQPMKVITSEDGAVTVALPLWAQPGKPATTPVPAPKKIGEGKSLMDEFPLRK